jgi:uncharacterized protein YaaR (DUF327 family)
MAGRTDTDLITDVGSLLKINKSLSELSRAWTYKNAIKNWFNTSMGVIICEKLTCNLYGVAVLNHRAQYIR